MKWNQPEQISDGAFFVVDVAQFTSPVTPYDPRLANQSLTFSSGNGDPNSGQEEQAPEEESPVALP